MVYCDWCAGYLDSTEGIKDFHVWRSRYGVGFHVCGEECKENLVKVLKTPALMNKTQKLYKWGNMFGPVTRNISVARD
jgi:hypothetical protein